MYLISTSCISHLFDNESLPGHYIQFHFWWYFGDLHELAVEIASACEGFSVLFTWIPREANVTADLLSKYVDADGWEISPDIFLQLDRLWGHFTLDVFASAHNAKAKCFLSKFHEIGSAGVDAFIHSWSGHNCWIIPPPHFRNSSCHRKTHVMSKAY